MRIWGVCVCVCVGLYIGKISGEKKTNGQSKLEKNLHLFFRKKEKERNRESREKKQHAGLNIFS